MTNKYSEGKNIKVIAVCIPQFNAKRQLELLTELKDQCSAAHTKMLVFSSLCNFHEYNIDQIGEEQIYYAFDPSRFDAVIIFTELFKIIDIPKKIALRAKQAGIAVISVGGILDGCINLNLRGGPAFTEIVRHVIEEHHVSRINFIAGIRNEYNSDERLRAFRREMEEHGLPVEEDRIGYGDYWENPTEQVMEQFWNSEKELPEAIICANDKMAMTVCQFLQKKGKRVPEDIIVTGYDGIELEQYFKPRLTTAECSTEKIIQRLMQLFDKVLSGEISHQGDYYLTPQLRLGESCGCIVNHHYSGMDKIMQLTWDKDCLDTFYNDEILRLIPKLSEEEDIRQMFSEIQAITERIQLRDFYYVINNDILDERYDMSVRIFESNTVYRWEAYTDTMFVPFGKADKDCFMGKKILLSDLLPDLDSIMEREDAIFFIPSHIQGQTLGYVAFTQLDSEQPYERAHLFVANFLYVMEIFRRRAEQDNLYLRDNLTKLYNRFGFYKYVIPVMKQCKEQNLLFTIISVDLDSLKHINDTYGHQEGDYAIQTMAQILMGFSRFGEVCSRFGGDEFVIAFGSAEHDHRAEEICEQCRSILKQFGEENDKPYTMNASFGIARDHVGDSKELSWLLDKADQRMYDEKREHREKRKTVKADA